jgi:hypothetical protein
LIHSGRAGSIPAPGTISVSDVSFPAWQANHATCLAGRKLPMRTVTNNGCFSKNNHHENRLRRVFLRGRRDFLNKRQNSDGK